jgi:hypothetical protein
LLQWLHPLTYQGQTFQTRTLPLLVHLIVGTLAYIGGYLLVPMGRHDLVELAAKVRRR